MQSSKIMELVGSIERSGTVTPDDVLALRRAVFGDALVTRQEAEALFALAQKQMLTSQEWQEFFVEALTDYLVHQEAPAGYVSEANAAWLIDMVSRDGATWTDTELELLVHVMDKAKSSPPELVRFAMGKVKEAVLSGEGPTRKGLSLKPGAIGAAEVDLLRRILYAFGGEGAAAVSRAEAETLFEINDATLNGDNDPSWQDLFVKAIANHLMALSGYKVPSREEALRREKWLEDTEVSVSGFFGRMLNNWHDVFTRYERPGRDLDFEAAVNERVTAEEARWLKDRILDNGRVCDNQQALLTFIRRESPDVHPELRDLMKSAA